MILNKLRQTSEKNKATIVVTLVVIALAGAFFHQGIILHSKAIDQLILKEEKSISVTINDIALYSFAPYKQRLFNLLSTKKEVPKAFLNRDRDRLYRITHPLYEALQRENKHLQIMHFHEPDGRSFLRMHNRKKFGDDLRTIRPAVQSVHQSRKPLTCYEIGIFGAYYRIIYPVFHEGSYAGALELGFRVHTLLEPLEKQISGPLTSFFVRDKWKKVTGPQEHEFLIFGKYTLNTHNDPFYKQLPADLDLSRDNQNLKINNRSFLMHTYPVFVDFHGEPIGGFIVMQDISQPLKEKKAFILQSLIFAGLMLTLALIVLHLTFGKVIGKLDRSRSTLKKTVDKLGLEVEERKETEKQLSKSKNDWERTFDSISDIITIMNSDLQIINANQAAYKNLNAKPGSLIGEFCYKVFGNRSSACDGCPAVDTINNRRACSSEMEHPNLEKNFLVTTAPVANEKGEFTNIVHIAKDITEKKALEKQLHQSRKMEAIGTLAGGIAHDFNNILTAISGYTQLAILKAGDDEKIANNLEQVKTATERATSLVTQILTFSRQTEHEKMPLQMSPIVKEALKLLRSSIPTTIEIKQNIQSQGNILADPTQIHQIIMNLATNAYHAMLETGGILGVSLQELTIAEKSMISEFDLAPGKYIRLEVSDTGSGMDEETKEKIFEPYFTTKDLDQGTGLGLAVVHGIVKGHHGHINVYSEPGQGTTFHVYLPTIEEAPEHYTPQGEEEPVRDGSERIMFVDDEDNIVKLASEFLTMYGYKVTSFTNGVQAFQDFEKHPDEYDLIVTDMSMPYMDGLQLTKKIREIRPGMPIVLCSGYSAIIIKEKALAMGIGKYIQKPLAMDRLAKVIRELMDMGGG